LSNLEKTEALEQAAHHATLTVYTPTNSDGNCGPPFSSSTLISRGSGLEVNVVKSVGPLKSKTPRLEPNPDSVYGFGSFSVYSDRRTSSMPTWTN
jgi:hypothetical protein